MKSPVAIEDVIKQLSVPKMPEKAGRPFGTIRQIRSGHRSDCLDGYEKKRGFRDNPGKCRLSEKRGQGLHSSSLERSRRVV